MLTTINMGREALNNGSTYVTEQALASITTIRPSFAPAQCVKPLVSIAASVYLTVRTHGFVADAHETIRIAKRSICLNTSGAYRVGNHEQFQRGLTDLAYFQAQNAFRNTWFPVLPLMVMHILIPPYHSTDVFSLVALVGVGYYLHYQFSVAQFECKNVAQTLQRIHANSQKRESGNLP